MKVAAAALTLALLVSAFVQVQVWHAHKETQSCLFILEQAVDPRTPAAFRDVSFKEYDRECVR